MLDATLALQHANIRHDTENGAIYDVRCRIQEETDQLAAASKLLHEIVGVDVAFTDARIALAATQRIIQAIVKSKCLVEEDSVQASVDRCIAAATDYVNDPNNAFHFAQEEKEIATTTSAAIEGTNIVVEMKSDGKMKKGGKSAAAPELYKKFLADKAARNEGPLPGDNQAFIKILMDTLGMSKAGATTYNYNMKKALGGTIVAKVPRDAVACKPAKALGSKSNLPVKAGKAPSKKATAKAQ